MIVRDEENSLADCLSSVRAFVDEIVILDTGSTDSTVKIAKSFGARVEYLSWPGDFAPARNAALKLVKGDWVLVLDADERLCPDCIEELRSIMALKNVLLVNLLRYERGAKMSPYSSVSRLFRRHAKIRWSRPYHSIVDDSVLKILKAEPQWRIVNYEKPALIHDGYRPEALQLTSKPQLLRDAMESWLSKHPGDPYACAKLGALEVAEGSMARGLRLLKEGLEQAKSTNGNVNERYELLLNLGIALAPTDIQAAINIYREALRLPMDNRANLGALLNLASLLMKMGDLEEAISLTSAATFYAPEVALSWYNLGLMKRHSGDLDGAINAYLRAIEINPFNSDVHQNLGLVKLLLGDIKGARESFGKALSLLTDQGCQKEADALRMQLAGVVKLDDS